MTPRCQVCSPTPGRRRRARAHARWPPFEDGRDREEAATLEDGRHAAPAPPYSAAAPSLGRAPPREPEMDADAGRGRSPRQAGDGRRRRPGTNADAGRRRSPTQAGDGRRRRNRRRARRGQGRRGRAEADALPRDVLDEILTRLGILDAARTSALSRAWRRR
ncbi:hypothetical protein QYE76_035881 [Lolium multiflorum]|uniref:F-box domain-containing protein n=1 Tax=Lolium multiflorum TaxID=4521 RepID=A0AAD8R3W1_LOLMU|nr:hypothetical protein QYE76_035881 [Lolium multiflorum]